MSEEDFQNTILELGKLYGWLCYHTHDSRRSREGFPDLVLGRNGVPLFAELKTDKGRVSNDQILWLLATDGVIWRPKHWDIIVKSLQDGRAYPTEPIPRMR